MIASLFSKGRECAIGKFFWNKIISDCNYQPPLLPAEFSIRTTQNIYTAGYVAISELSVDYIWGNHVISPLIAILLRVLKTLK